MRFIRKRVVGSILGRQVRQKRLSTSNPTDRSCLQYHDRSNEVRMCGFSTIQDHLVDVLNTFCL